VSEEPPGPPKRRVVIAEDEALIRLDLVEMLSAEGYDVVGEASDGEAAVELVRQTRPDLVLMDVKMPILDGISAAEAIRGIAPIILLTAFSQQDLIARALAAGVQGYVVKPFTLADLRPAIEIALARNAEVASLTANVASLSEQLATRKLVDRAKGILQTRYQLDEQAAFTWLQRTAMDRRTSMAEVAKWVLDNS
jgi:two-component system, response regulator PdtaR